MKLKYIIILFATVMMFSNSFAQNTNVPVYVKVYGSYGFLSPGSLRGEPSRPLTSDTSFFKVGKKGLGEGFRVGAGFGVILNDYINIGLDADYLKGNTIKIPISQSFARTTVTSLTTINHTILSVIPNITFKAVSKPSYHIYNRLGIIIGIPLEVTQDYDYRNFSVLSDDPLPLRRVHQITTTYHAEHTLKTGIGYQASLGVQIKITSKFRGFIEIAGYRLLLRREKYEEIEKVRRDVTGRSNVINEIATRPDRSRDIIYYKDEGSAKIEKQGSTDSYVTSYTHPQDPININSITAGAGIFYRF